MMDITGRPMLIDINKILDAAEEYIMCDDGQKAMWILDNLPAYYMDNYPLRAYEIKKTYYNKLYTIQDYLSDSFDNEWDEEKALKHYKDMAQWRGQYIKNLIESYNKLGSDISIIELGPANYWLPIGLKSEGLKFKYMSMGPNVYAAKLAKEKLKDIWNEEITGASIFVCMETIEHCQNPQDLFNYYAKIPKETEFIILTTPRYMIGNCFVTDWRGKDHGHVKTWGAEEFKAWAEKTWPLHNFNVLDKQHLILSGYLRRLDEAAKQYKDINGQSV